MDNNDPISSLLDQRLDDLQAQPEQPIATTGEKVINSLLRVQDIENNVALRQNSGTNADRQAEALRFSKQNKVPIGMAYRQLEDLKRSEIEATTEKMRHKYPAWGTLLTREEFGPIAQDPQFAGDLQFLEETLTGFKTDRSSLLGAVARGFYGMRSQEANLEKVTTLEDLNRVNKGEDPLLLGLAPFGGVVTFNNLDALRKSYTPDEWRSKLSENLGQAVRDQAAADAAAAQYPRSEAIKGYDKTEGFLQPFAYVLRNPKIALEFMAESLPASVPSMVGGAAAGPVGMGVMSARTEMVSTINEELAARGEKLGLDMSKPENILRVWNADGEEIMRKAEVRAGAVGLFDALSFKASTFLGSKAKSSVLRLLGLEVAGIASDASLGMAGEATAEALTEDEIKFRNILAEGIGEVPGGALQTAYSIATEGTAIRAENNHKKLITLGDRIRNSKANKISPETVLAHADALDESGAVSSMEAPVEAIVKLFQEEGYTPEQIAKSFPGMPEALDEAQNGNATVKLRASDVVKMAQLKGWNEFAGDIRVDSETPSINELKRRDAEADDFISSVSEDEQKRAVNASIENEITQQLIATGTEQRAAQTQSKFAMSIYNTISERTGIDVDTLRKRYPLTIRGEKDGSMSFGIEGQGDVKLDQATRDVLSRTPELQEGFRKLAAGEITQEQFSALVDQYKPVRPYTEVPRPATTEEMFNALTSNKRDKIGKLADYEEGYPVALRLDIPAYSNNGVWVPTIHDQKTFKTISHEPAAHIRGATFSIDQGKAGKVVAGGPKSPFATIDGSLLKTSVEDIQKLAEQAINDPAWTQVGMDPERHSYFYDRKTMRPVLKADEVIQVGPLVLAKNAEFGQADNFLFQSGVPLFESPMPIEGKATITKVAQALTDRHQEIYKRKLDPSTSEADYNQVRDDMIEEINFQLQRANSGVGWYAADVELAIRLLSVVFPSLRDNVAHRQLLLVYAAIFSSGKDPDQALQISTEAFETFLKTGISPISRGDAARDRGVDAPMTTFKDKSGKEVTREASWTQRGETNEQQLAFVRYIIEREGSLEAGMNWLLNEQPREEINRAMTESGLYQGGRFKTRAEIAGPPERGVLSFGPKLGRYAMGLQGVEIDEGDVTIDLWYIRTYRRLIGRLFEGPLDPRTGIVSQPNDTDRGVIRRLTGDLVAHFSNGGYTVGDIQAILWFYEKRLWAAHGLPLDEGTNSVGAKRFLEERGYYVGSKIGEAYDREGGAAASGVLGGQAPERLVGRQRSARRFVSRRLGRGGDEEVRLYGRRGNPRDRKVRGIKDYYVPNTALANDLEYAGYPVLPEIEELDPKRAEDFHKAISDARAASEYGAAVSIYKLEDYRALRLFLTPDKKAGFALKPDGDIISVFSDGGGKTAAMLALAVELGGTKLDAFDTALPAIYKISGFKEVHREPWNEEYKDPAWNYDTFKKYNNGRPDVVFMEYDPAYDPYAQEVTDVRDDQTTTLFQGMEPERAGNGRGRYSSGSLAPLEGAPIVEGASGPDANLVNVAEQYARASGISLRRQAAYAEVDEDRARRISDAYEAMAHAPQDPVVREAYENLIKQTKAQYNALDTAGYVFSFYDDATDPYAGNPWNAMRDLRQNKRMAVYGTYAGFGTEGVTGAERSDNPMLVDTGIRWKDQNGVELPVTANDLFRAVHDAFGHGLEGAGFRAKGEENAWQAHVRLYTGSAIAALTTGTRGQNSWLNYGPYGESNRTAAVEDTVFARQKIGLLPPWTWEEGRAADEAPETGPSSSQTLYQNVADALANLDKIIGTPEFQSWFGKSVVVDENGKPLVVYHGSEQAGFTVFNTDGGSAKTKGTGAFFSNKLSNAMTYSGKHTLVNFPSKEEVLASPGKYGFTVEEGQDGRAYVLDADGYQFDVEDGETVDQAMSRAVDDYFTKDRLAGPEQANVPVFLKIEKPLIIDAQGQSWNNVGGTPRFQVLDGEGNMVGYAADEQEAIDQFGEDVRLGYEEGDMGDGRTTDEIVREARQSGEYDGVIFKNVVDEGQYGWYDDPSDVYVVFYKNQIKSVQNQGTFSNDDPNILKQNARGYLRFPADRRAFEMTLTGKANLSTFVHESMHYFLEVMQDLVESGEAPQQMIDDLAKLREWTKLEAGEKFSVRAHEMVARGMEAYVREGRAPDNALQDIFNRLRAWMVFIYKKATALNVDLTDDVRGVFDRLVASDAAISEARTQLGWTKPLAQEALALTDAEYARYVEAWQKATDEQSRELDERMMREAAEVRKDLWQTETKRRFDEEKAKLAETRGYKAWKLLTEGKGLEEFGRTDLKIDPDTVPPEWRRDANGMMGEGGLPLELVAELLGFKSGENMLQLIAGAKFAFRDIPINVKKAMEAEHGHLDAAALADAANEAVIRPVAGVLLTEYRAMAAAAGIKPEPGLGEWLAATAKRKVQALTQRQLDPTRWRRAELKSAQESAAAAAKGDKQKAALAKRQQLMAAAMYRATIEAEKRIETIQNKLVPFTKDDRRAKLGKAGESYLDAIDEILEGISFKNVTAKSLLKQDRLAAFLKEAEENDLPVNVPENLIAALGKRNYSTMTLEELEGVHDTVMSIWHLAKTKNELKMRAEKRDMEQALTEMEANAQKALGDPKVKDSFVKGWKDNAADKLQWIRAQLTKMEFLFGWLDGQPSGGLMHKLIYQPLADANHEEFKLLKRFNSTIFARMRNLPKEQKARLAAKRTFMGKDADGGTILAAALNLGNEANKRKLLEGYGWTEPQLMAEINAFMRKEDWELVQYIWDEIDTLYPKIEAVTKAATGLAPERVEAIPVQTPFGQFRGGYYPVVYDPERTEQVFKNQQKADGLFTNNYLKPKLGDGFTKGRTGYVAPVLLNLSVLPNHLASVVHYVTHYEAIAQANKITSHPRFANLVKTHMGNRFYREIRPWLQDIAQNQDTPAITRQEFFSNGLKHLRGGYSIAAMGFNVFTGFKQLYGVTTALDAMKARYWASGLTKAWLSPNAIQNWKFALENSAELKPLVEQVDRDIAMINQTYQKNLAGGAKDAAVRYAFSHIGYFQLAVNVATWHGAFEQSLAEGKTKEQAIDDADSTVRKTQSSGAVKDLSRVQRGSEASRMVSMFYSWFNVLYNRLDEIARETNSISDVPRAAKRIAILVFYSAILEETFGRLYEGMTGGDDDDEDERGFILSVLLRGADQIIGTLPLIRAFVKAESPAPVVDIFKDMQRIEQASVRLVTEGKMPTKSEGRAVAKVASAVFHVPAKGIYDLVAEVHRVATGEDK